jgi:GNAT superfamily N-acetyltransferase
MTDAPHLRLATMADVPAIRALITESARALSVGYYTPAQIESALSHVLGVDTQLVADGTYYVAEAPDGTLAAAGGWSRRRLLYGGDQLKGAGPERPPPGDDTLLDPATEPARIRAFFVHPAWARRGLARRLFAECRAAARAEGFRGLTLGATLPGVPLYDSLGFVAHETQTLHLPDGVTFDVVRMTRPID